MTTMGTAQPAGIQAPVVRAGRVAQADMRAANMGLILRHLRSRGGRSRAQLAAETGVSKATTSSVIADLAERGLVREGPVVRAGAIGRPGQTVSLDGSGLAGIGLEINVHHAVLTAVNLAGTTIRESITPLDVARLPPEAVFDRTATLLARALASLREAGILVVGITVSPPGIIDYAAGSLRFAPNLHWRNVPLRDELTRRLGADTPVLRLENDAKLAALAEYEQHARDGVHDLIYVTGEVGVGAGIIADGRLVRGWSGFSGEVGHMPLNPEGTLCNCGRRGCWETAVGLPAFLSLADGEATQPRATRSLEDRLLELKMRSQADDAHVLGALTHIANHLATGLSVLVDVLNPQLIVLGGYYAHFGDRLIPVVDAALRERLIDAGTRTRIVTSRHGAMSSAWGGALLALEEVFADPSVVPPRS